MAFEFFAVVEDLQQAQSEGARLAEAFADNQIKRAVILCEPAHTSISPKMRDKPNILTPEEAEQARQDKEREERRKREAQDRARQLADEIAKIRQNRQ